jgi:hypothetical protein
MVARCDHHGIDILIVVQLPQVAVFFGARMSLGRFVEVLLIDVA